jgi:hypothetical protein
LDGDIDLGDGAAQTRLEIRKADNDNSDHVIFYNGTTRVGEIGAQDTSWLRLNQITNVNIYTPRYIRADNGFYVDGTTYGIDGNGHVMTREVQLYSYTPGTTTNRLYNSGGVPKFDGGTLVQSEPVSGAGETRNQMALSQSQYDAISVPDSNTLYFITSY